MADVAYLDWGDRTFFPICRDCGWRGYTTMDRATARHQADEHQRETHSAYMSGAGRPAKEPTQP